MFLNRMFFGNSTNFEKYIVESVKILTKYI